MDSDYYKTRYSYNKSREKVWKAICGYLEKYITGHSAVLDLGSGYCDFINNIPASTKYAVDSDLSSKQYCGAGINFLNLNVTDIDFKENSFDVVFASNLLEHLNDADLDTLIKKVFLCLREKGRIILIQPNYYYSYRNYWDDFTHVKAFSHQSLSDYLIAKGFKIIKVEKKFLPFSFKSILPKSYFLTKLYLNFFWHPFAKQMLIVAEKQVKN
jgi:SAM-dependent methyltransferase